MNLAFEAGAQAAKDGCSIDNSYPWNHEEFVEGYKSVKPQARENLFMKELAKAICPDEYKDLK
jgi:hypothetical protein